MSAPDPVAMQEGAAKVLSPTQHRVEDDGISPLEPGVGNDEHRQEFQQEGQDELKQLKTSLQQAVQSKRFEQFSFEPVSLPGSAAVSRAPSPSNVSSRRLPAGSSHATPRPSPPLSAAHSPPLTPARTSREGRTQASIPSISLTQRAKAKAGVVTPQRSASPGTQAASSRQNSVSEAPDAIPSQPRPTPRFSIGPSADSAPPSEDVSPSVTPGTTTPAQQPTDSDAQARGKKSPLTPSGRDAIEAQFRFGNRDPRHGYSSSSTNVTIGQPTISAVNLLGPGNGIPISDQIATANNSSATLNQLSQEKRSSIFGHKSEESEKKHSSSNLKRFFKFGKHHGDKHKKAHSPARDGTKTPPNGNIPFGDDHGIESKYGKFGKVLGSGAGGSVRLMKRTGDGKTFAVKQFRNRHSYESEKEYNKKVTSEFCIGSTLHHGNIIETIDIVHEKGLWFEVMEYAPYDLFATVMTGKMGKEEVTCSTLQILSGVTYLHSMGLAHRDLKLDNVVISEHGIMKLIDFGSAVVFKYPFEEDIVLSTGVVGSDPYLAPEVYDNTKYDPQLADIWSIAIIFCCMCLRRFPWKAPRMSDSSYRLFVSPPDPGQEEFLLNARRGSADKSAQSANSSETAQQIKGPIRLLRLLPRETRHIIGRMLQLDPRRRATIEEVLQDEWVQNALVCRQEEDGKCFHAPGHQHHLEGSGQSLVTAPR